MKPLKNQTLIYDDDCPMCCYYTSTFMNTGMLDPNGRKAFSDLDQTDQNIIDTQKASNEIALIDYENNTVLYGIDGLLRVIGNTFPWVEKVGNWKPINFMLKKLYKFIAFNRKVIVPKAIKDTETLQCTPDFNIKYRFLYMLFATTITILVLYKFANSINFFPNKSILREVILATGQIVFQLLFLYKKDLHTKINYIGNLLTVSLIGSLILIPIIILNSFFTMPLPIMLGWFGLTVAFMFYEHSRRINLLKLPKLLTYTWVLYRIIILFLGLIHFLRCY